MKPQRRGLLKWILDYSIKSGQTKKTEFQAMGAIKKWRKNCFKEFVICKSQIVLENRIYTIYEILPP